jgi:hypothetical protein
LKLADRLTRRRVAPSAVAQKCIEAREREADGLWFNLRRVGMSIEDVSTMLAKINDGNSIIVNRDLLLGIDKEVTALRARLRAVRHSCKTIAARDQREENGVLRP